jgi:hypothetical protein
MSFRSTSDNGRRRRSVLPIVGRIGLATAAAAALIAVAASPSNGGSSTRPFDEPEATAGASATTRTSEGGRIRYPVVGPRRWSVAPGTGDVIGKRGRLLRFRVAVERGITNVDAAAVAALVEQTLGDPRGWTAGGAWRFRRVGRGQPYHFTIYIATPATRDVLCAMGYDRYTSCRNGNRVVLNVARWAHGVPRYRAPLDTYRQYVINHEVGHLLGKGHERCPARGRPAPVMQQQTLGLHGCAANAWPFLNGRRYRGPSGTHF